MIHFELTKSKHYVYGYCMMRSKLRKYIQEQVVSVWYSHPNYYIHIFRCKLMILKCIHIAKVRVSFLVKLAFLTDVIIEYNDILDKKRSRWCNGLERLQQWPCYLQRPGFKFQLRPDEFFLQQGFSTQQSNSSAKICAMCLNKLGLSYQRYMQSNQKKMFALFAEEDICIAALDYNYYTKLQHISLK